MEELAGATDAVEARPTDEEECQAPKAASAHGEAFFVESTELPLDPKLVDDAVGKELEPMRTHWRASVSCSVDG